MEDAAIVHYYHIHRKIHFVCTHTCVHTHTYVCICLFLLIFECFGGEIDWGDFCIIEKVELYFLISERFVDWLVYGVYCFWCITCTQPLIHCAVYANTHRENTICMYVPCAQALRAVSIISTGLRCPTERNLCAFLNVKRKAKIRTGTHTQVNLKKVRRICMDFLVCKCTKRPSCVCVFLSLSHKRCVFFR